MGEGRCPGKGECLRSKQFGINEFNDLSMAGGLLIEGSTRRIPTLIDLSGSGASMKMIRTLAPILILSSVPLACREQSGVSQESELHAQGTDFTAAPAEVFGLARFVQTSEYLNALKPYVDESGSFLLFGDRSKFGVETNLSVEARGGSALVGGGERYINAQYYLDGYVFGKELSTGRLVDIAARADLSQSVMNGHIRFLGDDKYKGEIKTGFSKSFVRDLSIERVVYGTPLLGVTVGGTIGGEIGLKGSPGLRADGAVSFVFEPNIIVNSSLSGGVKVLTFANAEILGSAMLMDLKVAGSANLGYSPFNQFVYGNAGLDGGTLDALDGKVEILANADLDGILPSGVDASLWQLIGLEKTDFEFRHTLFDPIPLYTQDIPSRTASFYTYLKTPGASCNAMAEKTIENLNGRLDRLERETSQLSDQALRVNKSSEIALKSVIRDLTQYCESLTAGGSQVVRLDNKGF